MARGYGNDGMTPFAKRLRIAIEESGMTMSVVARLAHLGDCAHLSNLCAGRKAPSFEVLRRLVVVLPDADARWLICGGRRMK